MNQFITSISILGLLSLFLTNCGEPPAQYYAKHFCACSSDFSKAGIQLKAGTIDQATYQQIATEHEACLGDDDPLEALKDKPEELAKFKRAFIEELEKQCPDIARNLGF